MDERNIGQGMYDGMRSPRISERCLQDSQEMSVCYVRIWPTMDLLSLEMVLERLIDDLRDGQAVKVCLAPDRLDPAALDMEGNALGPLGSIARLGEGHLAVSPPDHEFLKGRYQGDNPVIRGRSLGPLFAGCSHERLSRARK